MSDQAFNLQLFHRSYKLQVEDIDVKELAVRFTVKRSLSSKVAGRCEITIFNMWEDSRDRLHAMRNVFCSLEAGYVSGRTLIFRGDLVEAWSYRQDTEWLTVITSDDGGKARKSARAQRNYIQGTSLKAILESLAAALGLGKGNLDTVAAGARYWKTNQTTVGKGLTASGDAISQLDRVARSCGLSWSIQDGELQFLKIGDALPDAPILLTPETGLIDSPELGKDQVVKARCLIIPGIHPGRLVELQSRHANGLYRIDTSTHEGDSDGDSWQVDLELTALKR